MTGQVQVYTGDGKGKTTAAVGLALRSCGAGLRVYLGQFLKDGSSAEVRLLRARCPEVTLAHYGTGHFVAGAPSAAERAAARAGLGALQNVLTGGAYDVVIADEINVAAAVGCLRVDDVLGLIDRRPAGVELVLTGRDAHPRVLERAALVTEMRCAKHYHDAGQPPRPGIEF